MEIVSELFSDLIKIWKEMLVLAWTAFVRLFKILIWLLCAIIILPCDYVAGNLYPLWIEWGEDM